ncbi:hypothetical protein [Streptomyces aidingensis]|uniref:SAF domain-containing protein n=1 Tax=Streptomyces aidingensis TaxID=910347 RepID=A0A1I1F4D0_9ACTN|nr:hypothetical protein [Streptomyces aidingensis]SFB94117.1 hypothetical protein SAMN05421773_101611 [Streptomyces aidingensis]
MKTQNRVSAAAKNPVAAGPALGDRLPTPPRERKPALAALAVLLILVGALGATVLVLQAGDRVEAVQITERIPAGQPIPEDAMTPVLVAEADGVDFVLWGQRDQIIDGDVWSRVDLVEGTVLVEEMFTRDDQLGADDVLVGLSLSPGQYPTGLEVGQTVAVYWVGNDAEDAAEADDDATGGGAGPGRQVLSDAAKVVVVDGGNGNRSDLSVTVRVPTEEVAPLTRAASGGDVAVAIVAPAGSED